jgi:hypothetical protein
MTEILLKVTLITIKPNPMQEIILAKVMRERKIAMYFENTSAEDTIFRKSIIKYKVIINKQVLCQ